MEGTHVVQHMIDVLVSSTEMVLKVVYAAGQTMGPMLQLVTVFETVDWPSHHCVAWGGRQVNVFATDSPYPGSYM